MKEKFTPVKGEDTQKTKITVSLSDNMTERIDRIAQGLCLSRAAFLTQCIQYALDNIDPATEKSATSKKKK